MKGRISSEFTAWCGKCHEWQQESAPNKTAAVKKFKLYGWKIKKDHGWVCPKCLNKEELES